VEVGSGGSQTPTWRLHETAVNGAVEVPKGVVDDRAIAVPHNDRHMQQLQVRVDTVLRCDNVVVAVDKRGHGAVLDDVRLPQAVGGGASRRRHWQHDTCAGDATRYHCDVHDEQRDADSGEPWHEGSRHQTIVQAMRVRVQTPSGVCAALCEALCAAVLLCVVAAMRSALMPRGRGVRARVADV
jgi:hypothetical protein